MSWKLKPEEAEVAPLSATTFVGIYPRLESKPFAISTESASIEPETITPAWSKALYEYFCIFSPPPDPQGHNEA